MERLYESPVQVVLTLGNLFLALSVFLFLMYVVQVQSFRSRTQKYKFVSERESHALWGMAILFTCSVGLYVFVLSGLSIGLTNTFHYYLSGLIALVVGVALGYVLWSYISYYHPFILEKRLRDIRFGPMRSPVTGKPMTLLNEAQEDAHLTKEMIEDEDTLTVDYDVWIDQESDYKVIEQYNTHFHALVCESCNFRTLKEKKQEIIREPREREKGILRKYYVCTHCGHIESRDVTISSLADEGKFEKYDKDILEFPQFNRSA